MVLLKVSTLFSSRMPRRNALGSGNSLSGISDEYQKSATLFADVVHSIDMLALLYHGGVIKNI